MTAKPNEGFGILKGFPPNRPGPIVELWFYNDGVNVGMPAEIYRENGDLKIATFGCSNGVQYLLREFLDAIQKGVEILDRTGAPIISDHNHKDEASEEDGPRHESA